MKLFYFLLLSLTLGNAAFAAKDQGIVTGKIIDEQSKPIDFVTVGLFKAADSSLVKTALTNQDGTFEFNGINLGQYYVKATIMGHETHKGKVFAIIENKLIVALENIMLTSTAKTLKSVSVTAMRPLIERKTDKLVMNVENSSIAIGSSALEVLQKAPGITVDQNDNISMQGKQGVLIMLDGKQTYMSNADVANLLRNMQSSELETIELITNPSSKYDAAGNSGIINIKTKKNKNGGTNGSVNAGLGYGKYLRANAGLNLNHRTQKINVFGSYNRSMNKRGNYIGIDRISNGTTDTYFSQEGTSVKENNNNNAKIGLDYFINKKNTIGVLVNGYFNKSDEDSYTTTLIGPSFSQTDKKLLSTSNPLNKYDNTSYNLNYKSILDTAGSELSVDLDYSRFKGSERATYNNTFFNPDGSQNQAPILIRNSSPTQIDIKAFKVDYNVALSKTLKLESGIKSSWVKTDNDLQAEEFVNNAWQNDVLRSNRFVYDENVNAIYTNLNQSFKKTTIQLGLRVEQTTSKGNLITSNTVVERSYWDFFPTFFIQHELAKNNQLGFSYSRRIDRPSYDDLNPFMYYLDQYTYSKGNPFLNPQYTNSFELSYTFMQKYLLSLSYSRTNDAISQVILPDPAQQALYQTNANLAKNITYGANLNVPVKITKWWEMNNNLNVFHLKFESPNLAGRELKTGKTSFQFKLQQTFIIVNGLTAELSGNYESPLDYGTLSIQSRYAVDMGISKSLWNKKASLKFAVSDIFDMNNSKITSAYPGLTYNLYQKNESRVARLSFSYRFGKNEIKPARRRSIGTEAEQGRMKN